MALSCFLERHDLRGLADIARPREHVIAIAELGAREIELGLRARRKSSELAVISIVLRGVG